MSNQFGKMTPPINLDLDIKGQGLPLIFIHGWAASQLFWKYQIPFFSQRFQVVTYDLRGHGNSEKPQKGYTLEDHVQDLHHVITEHSLTNPIFVGHSLGGMIALQYTLEYPKIPKALVIVGASPHPVLTWKASFQLSVFSWILRLSRSRAAQFTKGRLFAPDPNPELVKWVNEDSLRTPTHVILASLKTVKRFNVLDRISEISQPTALVKGEYDIAVDLSVYDHMIETMPRAQRAVIPKAGHNCMLEQPQMFNTTLMSFLRQIA